MSISVNSIGRDELESITKKLLAKEIESKKVENQEGVKAEVKGDIVTISEEGRALSQDKEKSGTDPKQGSEKSEDSTKSDKADKSEKDGKAEGGAGAEGTGRSQSELDKLIAQLRKKINMIEHGIQELSNSNMPDELKQALLGAKKEQRSLFSNQLQQVMEEKTKAFKKAEREAAAFSVKI